VARVNSALLVLKKTKLSRPSRKTPGVIGTEVIYQDSRVYEIRQVTNRCFKRFLCMVGGQHHSNRFSIEHDLERTSVRGSTCVLPPIRPIYWLTFWMARAADRVVRRSPRPFCSYNKQPTMPHQYQATSLPLIG